MKKDEKIAGKGASFGQYALTGSRSGQMRGATVYAAEDCHFAILDRKSYDVTSIYAGTHRRNREERSCRKDVIVKVDVLFRVVERQSFEFFGSSHGRNQLQFR